MKIILSGGGTMGSVSTLIAVFEYLKKNQPQAEFLWLATRTGPEEKLIESYGITVKKIFSGKFRRYFSLKNIFDPIFIFLGFFQSLYYVIKFRPDWILSAGGFVSVPLVWSAWFLRKKILIHQQDVIPGLANKLMSPFATKISVVFSESAVSFPKNKIVVVGNPVRSEIFLGHQESALKFFKLEVGVPTLLVIGGGTGAQGLNDLLVSSAAQLVEFCQIIHLTGGKVSTNFSHPRYHPYDFLLTELNDAYAVSDLVISRAGLSTLSELSVLGKPVIVIPLPDSQQEANAEEFLKYQAVKIMAEKNIKPGDFSPAIKKIIYNQAELLQLGKNIQAMMSKTGAAEIAKLIYEQN
ncbi:MAG: UDP-N-acetylglucosamine--N-acetylmuramyl-(pentapeptide) pyrophosphoryl-undecaprenol N-acetylglucosamine transferase [Patescibacteria group bacterium]|nr:UDP-N-acetylglucosamine--N-acetylmuramyl-(pentapeptide) pyrophosphoryl-undecaprenol N-acetylglucosamine transferase [Patescibacteria group bacterium]